MKKIISIMAITMIFVVAFSCVNANASTYYSRYPYYVGTYKQNYFGAQYAYIPHTYDLISSETNDLENQNQILYISDTLTNEEIYNVLSNFTSLDISRANYTMSMMFYRDFVHDNDDAINNIINYSKYVIGRCAYELQYSPTYEDFVDFLKSGEIDISGYYGLGIGLLNAWYNWRLENPDTLPQYYYFDYSNMGLTIDNSWLYTSQDIKDIYRYVLDDIKIVSYTNAHAMTGGTYRDGVKCDVPFYSPSTSGSLIDRALAYKQMYSGYYYGYGNAIVEVQGGQTLNSTINAYVYIPMDSNPNSALSMVCTYDNQGNKSYSWGFSNFLKVGFRADGFQSYLIESSYTKISSSELNPNNYTALFGKGYTNPSITCYDGNGGTYEKRFVNYMLCTPSYYGYYLGSYKLVNNTPITLTLRENVNDYARPLNDVNAPFEPTPIPTNIPTPTAEPTAEPTEEPTMIPTPTEYPYEPGYEYEPLLTYAPIPTSFDNIFTITDGGIRFDNIPGDVDLIGVVSQYSINTDTGFVRWCMGLIPTEWSIYIYFAFVLIIIGGLIYIVISGG